MRPPPGPRDLQGRAIGGLAVAVDITARKQAEVALRRTADELRYKNEELSRLTDVLRTVNLTPETRVAERTSELTLRTNQLQGLAVQLVRAKQDKRRRIAQVIHDHLQQLLVATRLRLDSLCARSKGLATEQELQALVSLIAESLKASRSPTSELCPPVLYREGLPQALNSEADFEVVGLAVSGLQALEQTRCLRPDVIMIDVAMPEMNGIEAIRQVLAELSFV